METEINLFSMPEHFHKHKVWIKLQMNKIYMFLYKRHIKINKNVYKEVA